MWSGMCIGVFGVYWYLNVVRDVHWSIWSLLVLECGQWSGMCIGVFGVYWYLNVVRDMQGCALEYLESTGT